MSSSLTMSGVSEKSVKPFIAQASQVLGRVATLDEGKPLMNFLSVHGAKMTLLTMFDKNVRFETAMFAYRHQDEIARFAEGGGKVSKALLDDTRKLMSLYAKADRSKLAREVQSRFLPALDAELAGMPFYQAASRFLGKAF